MDKNKGAKAKAKVEKSFEKIKELAKVPKCKLEWREGKAHIVCDTLADQKIAYNMVAEGIVLEVKPEVEKVE